MHRDFFENYCLSAVGCPLSLFYIIIYIYLYILCAYHNNHNDNIDMTLAQIPYEIEPQHRVNTPASMEHKCF